MVISITKGVKDLSLAVKRKNRKIGHSSRFMNIPKPLKTGEESTIAADRLVLADPRGEIDEEKLLEFLEENLEPEFWKWHSEKRNQAENAGKGEKGASST